MSLSADVSSLLSSEKSASSAMTAAVRDGSLVTHGKSTPVKSNDTMDKDDFLLLLVTQLRYQDPLSPMDNLEFVGQLAQFRQLEGTNNMQNSIEELNTSFKGTVDAQQGSARAMANTSAVSMIGKIVRLKETAVSWSGAGGEEVPVRVNLGNSDRATVQILDSDGSVVKTLETQGKGSDSSAVVWWDGSSDSGKPVKGGTYSVHIAGSESNPELYAFVQDEVMGVRFNNDKALLKIGGKELPIDAIMDVSMGEGTHHYGGLSHNSALALLGKSVQLYVDALEAPEPGSEVAFNAWLGDTAHAILEVVDSGGRVVARLDVVNEGSGRAHVSWDGTGLDTSTMVAPGMYGLRFAQSETNPHLYAYLEGTVDGLNTSTGAGMVKVEGRYFPLGQIIEISHSGGQEGCRVQEEQV